MREIKFRMWTGKEIVYRKLTDRNWYYTPKNDENGCNTAFEALPKDVNHKIMQCTGLNDKNGKEIYEGDIIKFQWPNEDYDLAKIIFIRGGFMANRLAEDGVDNIMLSIACRNSEIIGNVYENPELLKESNNAL